MKTVYFEPLYHRNQDVIALRFDHDTGLNRAVRSIKDIRWSQTHRCWYIPMQEAVCKKALSVVREMAYAETQELRRYLQKRKEVLSIEEKIHTAARCMSSKQFELFVRDSFVITS